MTPAIGMGITIADVWSRCTVDDCDRRIDLKRPGTIGSSVRLAGENGPSTDDLDASSLIGCGLQWPPAARIDREHPIDRIPSPIAWQGLCGDLNEFAPPLGVITRAIMGSFSESTPCSLVIPDTLPARSRKALLQQFTDGWKPRLLWRPVASTLAWIESNRSYLELLPKNDLSLGFVLSLHLGLDSLEATLVEVRRFTQGPRTFILPARRLPAVSMEGHPSTHHGAARLAELVAERLSESDPSRAWNMLWCSDWCGGEESKRSQQLHPRELLDFLAVGTSSQFHSILKNASLKTPTQNAKIELTTMRSRILKESFETVTKLDQWLKEVRRIAAHPGIIGTVATGSISESLMKGERFDETAALINLPTANLLQTADGYDPLSHGAALYSRRLADGEPGYLDTLPRIETLVTRQGEPGWLDLTAQEDMSDEDRFVVAGKVFDEVVPDQGIGVAKESDLLQLTLTMEGEARVKENRIELAEPVTHATPVNLRVLMDPGQGSPRLVIEPDDPDAFRGRRVEIDWSDRPFSEKTRTEALEEVPRTNPPTEVRIASLASWQGSDFFNAMNGPRTRFKNVRSAIKHFIQIDSDWRSQERALKELRGLLRANDQNFLAGTAPVHATAFSSDGEIHPDADDPLNLVKTFKEKLLDIISESEIDKNMTSLFRSALGCAGYCGLRKNSLQNGLLREMKSRPGHESELICLGNTIKTNRECKRFFESMIKVNRVLSNNELRALSRVLQYREDALMDVDSEACNRLMDSCTTVLQKQVEQANAQYLFRHASISIVYLLRRRRYDESFLAPSEARAMQIKSLFTETIRKFERREMTAVGGFVDLRVVAQRLIDYIDRRGQGRLTDLID